MRSAITSQGPEDEQQTERGPAPVRRVPTLVLTWTSLIVVSWLILSGVVYLGFKVVETGSDIVATITAPDAPTHGRADVPLTDIAPAAGQPAAPAAAPPATR